MKKVPFGIEYKQPIEEGECQVVTREGNMARIICWDAKGECPIIALVLCDDWSERAESYTLEGRWENTTLHEDVDDLFCIFG